MLDADPTLRYALISDTEADPEAAIATLAIRGKSYLRVPHRSRQKYDPFTLMSLLEQHGERVH